MYVEMIHVTSTAIRAVGYDENTLTLTVEFRSGRVYDHPGVPYHHFEGLLNASSVGTYYNNHIRGKYR
jgi:hypothetical protein